MSTATYSTDRPPTASGASLEPQAAVARHPLDTCADDVIKVLRDDGSLDPAHDPKLPPSEVITLYKAMLRVRQLDERLVALQRQGRIGFHIGSLGEEAAVLGSASAMRPQDWLFPCYREFGAALWRGLPLQRYIDNMFGNANDTVKGRQMPDHYTYRAGRFGSVSSPIGTQITQAVGFAWAAKLKRDDLATLVYFGDGATSSSDFHSGLNFAGVYKAPVVFFCRNNGWAISVPTERQTASPTFACKGVAYGVPGVRVDGNDLFAVVKVTRDAVERAARGEGATLIEAMTYRLSGHSTSDDPKAYRPDAWLEPWRRLDPIERLRRHLERAAGWTEAQDREIEAAVDAEVKACVAVAEKTPPPPLDSMFEDVYAEPPWHLVEQREQLKAGPRPRGHGGH
ncbi:thiamine pyrophosphate-dependent dehydrogenase E1 component subunit alpha [Sorangium sp. So ce1036]|uniref:thiamine pyrophosphate-dependent dehydrogenase E1 component subunit alpha n=1 Tax=Sorangium sp. So ce1036 TaxID=3133328 RepID=UPI003EFBD88C